MDLLEMKLIEERSLNAWPALKTMLYDGWLLRFADGYTKRANSISPIYGSTEPIDEKITRCEAIYAEQQLATVYKITPFAAPDNLDQLLAEKGYTVQDETILQRVDLTQIPQPTYADVHLEHQECSEWIAQFARLRHAASQEQATMLKMFQQLQPERCFLTLSYENQVVACGLAVYERDYVGLFDIITDACYRKKGFGEQVVLHLLNWAKKKRATYGYLQVVTNNAPARRLYAKLGFQEVYRYWYRVKELSESTKA